MNLALAVASRTKRHRIGTKNTATHRIGIAASEMRSAHESLCTAVTWARPAESRACDADDIWSNGAETPPPTRGIPLSVSPALVRPSAKDVADESVCRPTPA